MVNSIKNFTFKQSLSRAKAKRTGSLSGQRNSNSSSSSLKSKTGTYVFEFTKMYNNVTDRDLDLRQEYGRTLISNYHSINGKYIHLKEYNDNFGLTNKTSNYHVKMGKIYLGQLSIRVQQTFSQIHLIYTYKKKKNPKL